MNKKAQVGAIGFILLVVIFVINWAIWLGTWLSEVGQVAIIENNLTGVEAFFFANLNLWVFIALILGTMGFLYFGGGSN